MRLLVLLRIVLAGCAFLGFGLGGWLLSVLVLPIVYVWPGTRPRRRKRCQRVVSASFRFFHAYMRVAGLIDYRPRALVGTSEVPSVWVANHPSLVDVTAVIAAEPELCVLVKSSVYRSPLFFPLMLACGHICVDEGERGFSRVLSLAAERLSDGHSVLIFPEGTRSPAVGLAEFQAGAFAIAIACGAPIQPLLLVASTPFLKRGTPWYRVPRVRATLNISALPPLDTTAPQVNSRGLCRLTYELLASRLREALPPGSGATPQVRKPESLPKQAQ